MAALFHEMSDAEREALILRVMDALADTLSEQDVDGPLAMAALLRLAYEGACQMLGSEDEGAKMCRQGLDVFVHGHPLQ